MGEATVTMAGDTRPEIGLSVREAARRIGCDPSRVRKLLKAGRLLGYRDGRRIRVRESSVVAYQDATPLAETSGAQGTEIVSRTNRQRQREALAVLQRLGVRSER